MAYVEVHTIEREDIDGEKVIVYRAEIIGIDTGDFDKSATVTEPLLLEGVIRDMGVVRHGIWEPIMGDGTHDVQRALIEAHRY